jgi:hypothetical protein
MTPIAAWKIAKGFLPTSPQQIVTMVALCGLCLSLGFCKGDDYRNAKWKAKVAVADVREAEGTIVANGVASEERVDDALRIRKNEEDLIDAIADIPDSKPSVVRVAAGCERLRQNGYTDQQLPSVCRHPSGSGTSTDPAR